MAKLSKYQSKVLKMMLEGYKIIYTPQPFGGYTLRKDLPNGYIHSVTMLASTFNNLHNSGLIAFDSKNKFGQKYYSLINNN